jgi:hypothetical protein
MMSERERPRNHPARPSRGDDADGAGLERARQAGDDLLAAGDAAIARALSGDSERFLRANRQQSGQ